MKEKNGNLVIQSNKLIEARYRLSALEQKLLSIMIGDISPDDRDFKDYRYKVSDIVDWLSLQRKDMYAEMQSLTARLITRIISIATDDKLYQTSWLSSATYIKNDGMIELRFDPGLKPYLLQLKSCFTEYYLDDFLSLKSKYAMRLYELLKQYLTIGQRKFRMQELRGILGLKNSELDKWSNFKRVVLEMSEKEINSKTDIKISYAFEKIGRKIEYVIFKIKKQESEKVKMTTKQASNLTEIFELIPEQYRNLKTLQSEIEKYFMKKGAEYVERNIKYTNLKVTKNYRVYCIKALKNDWGRDWADDKQIAEKTASEELKNDVTKQEHVQKTQAEQIENAQDWRKKWNALSLEEQSKWGNAAMGYGKYRSCKGVLTDD